MKKFELKTWKTMIFLTLVLILSTSISAVTNQSEGAPQDNFDETPYSYGGYHNRMQDSSNQLEPGAETERNWNLTEVFGENYRVYSTRDSIPGPDNWALTKQLNYSISNRGKAYPPGYEDRSGCFYRPGIARREALMDEGTSKKDKLFGNSFANASDWDGDGAVEGVWEDPDEMRPSFSNFTCDITGKDMGYGFDNITGDQDGKFWFKNGDKSTNVSIGDIAFVDEFGKSDPFAQEPPACGDDHKEYLIEELGATINSFNKTGGYACSGRRDVCVARNGGSKAVYRHGDLVNTEEAVENFGTAKTDKEICETEESEYGPFGVWYDQDYNKEYCQANDLYGNLGIRWINASYIDNHPYSVLEGVDDDLNPYLYRRGEAKYTSTQGSTAYVSGETPVPTGKMTNRSVGQYYSNKTTWTPPSNYLNLTVSKGFCGGDDEGENLIVQRSSTSLVKTNYSVKAIASSADDCVLDGANYPGISDTNRRIYSSGDEVTVDLGSSTRKISCYGGTWYENWPVLFRNDNVSVQEETERQISFQLINVQSTETEFQVDLLADTPMEPYTEFTQGGATFTATLPAQTSQSYSIDLYGSNSSLPLQNVTVQAEATSGNIKGNDTATVNIVDRLNTSTGGTARQQASEVPGIGGIQMLIMMLLASMMYYVRPWE